MASKKFFDITPPKKIQKKVAESKRIKKKESKKPLNLSRKLSIPKPTFSLKKIFGPKKAGVFVLFFLVFLVIFLHLSAKAEIEIWPKTESFSRDESLLVDAEVSQPDFLKKLIPGSFFSKEKTASEQFTATGTLEKQNKASGQIRVYNNYHLVQTLVATTRFVSADGKLFRSTEKVDIPAGGYLDVAVIAAEPGPEYNIKPSTFSIPGLLGSPRYTAVYGKSLSVMTGGDMKKASQVTKADLERAKNELFEKLTDSLEKELKDTTGPSFLLLEKAIEYETLESSCSKEAGEEAEKFECSLKVRSEALGFSESDLKDWAQKFILQELEEPTLIKEDSLKIESIVKDIDFETKKISLKVKLTTEIFPGIDISLLKEALREKSLKESEALLRTFPGIEKTKIRVFPFWQQSIPQDLEKIEIRLNVD